MKRIFLALILVISMFAPFVRPARAATGQYDVINPRNITGQDIVDQARTYYGVPYRSGDYRTRTGFTSPQYFDCSGFVYRVCRDVGLTSTRKNYVIGAYDNDGRPLEGQDAAGNYYITAHTWEQRYYGTPLTSAVAAYRATGDYSGFKPGDLLFLDYDGDYQTNHAAIYTGGGKAIHASSSRGIIEVPLAQSGWPNGTMGNSLYYATRLITCEHTYDEVGVCTNCGQEYDFGSTYTTVNNGYYTVVSSDGVTPRTQKPYDAAAADTEVLGYGAEVEVTGTVTNCFKESWYKISYGEKTGYTKAENLSFATYGDQVITCQVTSPAEGEVVPKSSYHIVGSITSKYELAEVKAYIDGSCYTTFYPQSTNTLSLKTSNVNNNLWFSSLAVGKHVLRIEARDVHHTDMITVCNRTFYTETKTTDNTISYNANGGTGAPANQTKKQDASITLSSVIPEKFGGNFLGWSESASATAATWQPEDTYCANSDLTLYAVWGQAADVALTPTGITEGSVAYPGAGSWFEFTTTGSGSYEFESTSADGTDDQIALYSADGTQLAWDDNGAGNGRFLLSYDLEADTTYYLRVKLNNSATGQFRFKTGITYEMRFDANGGTNAPESILHTGSVTVPNAVPVCSDYVFLGWSEDPGAEQADYQAGQAVELNSSVTLYAVWKMEITASGVCGEDLQYRLTYDGVLRIFGTGHMTDYPNNDAPWNDYREQITAIYVAPDALSIGECAFSNLPNLEQISLPETLQSINSGAISSNGALKSLKIPAQVSSISGDAFLGHALENITVDVRNPNYCTDSRGVLYSGDMTKLVLAPATISGVFTPAATVTAIENYAFCACADLTGVVLPAGVRSIGVGAFARCARLEYITIPESLETVGMAAFSGCENLANVCYDGTRSQWESISFASFGNTELLNAGVYYGHNLEGGECTVCGHKADAVAAIWQNGVEVDDYWDFGQLLEEYDPQSQYIRLLADTSVDAELTADVYIDMNGHNLSGTLVTNGHAVYGMDNSTDTYADVSAGCFSCEDENAETIVPARHLRTDLTGTVKRYLAIPDGNGYSFHRFYLGVTHMTVKPAASGVGYKAVFCGDRMVAGELDSYGYSLWFDGYGRYYGSRGADSFESGKALTLCVYNFDVENFGEKQLHAAVTMTLKDGTVIESSDYTLTLRSLVETVNAQAANLTQTQRQALEEMIRDNPIMQTWKVDSIIS